MSAQKSPSKQQPPQAVFTPLLNNLFSSITSNKGSLLQETRLNFYNRILFSRFNLFNSNETQIVNTLFDKAEKATSSLSSSGTKSKSQIESIERLQTLYARLYLLQLLLYKDLRKKFLLKDGRCFIFYPPFPSLL